MQGDTTDPAILIDLLQAMVSQTHWVYAELWAPRAGRLVTEAVWWRPGKGGEGFERLERMSRAMAVSPGSDFAGQVWSREEPEWVEDMNDRRSPLHESPRHDAVKNAGILSSLTVPVKIDSGDCVGVVVLMGQRPEPVNESKLQSVVALCTSAAPFLEHINMKSENQPPNNSSPPDAGGARRDSATSIASNVDIPADAEKARLSRLTIKYPPPQRVQFRSLGSDSGNPGSTPLKLATQSGDRSHRAAGAADPRGRQRGSATNYMTQLVTALQKCKEHEVGSPDAIRTNVAWVMLEQMAADVPSYSECLSKIVDELRPAIFGDDLIAMDDGMSMVKAPYFSQMSYREQQVMDMEAKVAESVAALGKVKQELEAVGAELAEVKANEEGMKRKVFLAERAVIKMRLSKFLEHRGMQAKLDADKAGEIKALKDEVNDLSTKLGIKVDSGISEMVPNVEERAYLYASVEATGILRPPMKESLMEPPSLDPTIYGPWKEPLSQEDEGYELKEQLLILRNAILTGYEQYVATTDKETRDSSDEKCMFVMKMEELENELRILEGNIESGWLTPRYELDERTKSNAASREGSPRALDGGEAERGDGENEGQGRGGDEGEGEEGTEGGEEVDEEELKAFWTDKGSKASEINIWKAYERRCEGKAREHERILEEAEITQWVYEIFEEKVRLDIESQNKGSQGYMTIEKVFFRVLDERYGAPFIADLAAFDFLSYIDQHKSNVKLFHLFASAMSGGWYDADWKYILRVQQFITSLAPSGFSNMLALDEFLVKHFYQDQPQSEIHRVLKAFTVFPTYNRQLAESDSEAISPELFAEFIAYLLEIKEEPRLRKVGIMIGITSLDKPMSVSYQQFESFANTCVSLPLRADISQLYYRMMIRSHPDQMFPPSSLAMAITAVELEVLLDNYVLDDGLNMASKDKEDPSWGAPILRVPSNASTASDRTATSRAFSRKFSSPMTTSRVPSAAGSPLATSRGNNSPMATSRGSKKLPGADITPSNIRSTPRTLKD